MGQPAKLLTINEILSKRRQNDNLIFENYQTLILQSMQIEINYYHPSESVSDRKQAALKLEAESI